MINVLGKISPVLFEIGNFSVRWYALCILVGALLTLTFSQWAMKRGGYPKEIFETLFFITFPSGLIGARLWWCIADSSSPWHHGDFLGFFKIWEGGLAIQGGVILGVLVGIIVALKRYKKVNLFFAMDAAIPNILIAQVLGRWGNFFNQEVYGSCVNPSELSWLPNFIKEQMAGGNGGFGEYVGAGIKCSSDEIAQPLFLYESLINFVGWVLISIILRIFWKKGYHKGDLSGLYLIWYGVCRAILEPLRNPEYIMDGLGGASVSVYTSYVFIFLGVALMVFVRIKSKFKKSINQGEEKTDD